MGATTRYVIRGAWVLSQDPDVGDLPRADVLIEGRDIAAVAPDLGPVDAEEVDGADRIALPGFVDSHRHSWQSLIRHMSTDWTLAQYFSGVRGVLGRAYEPEDMYAANLIAMLDALDSGITTLVDWSHNNNTPGHADAAIQAVFDSGIRAVWAYGNANDEWLPVSDVPQSRDVLRVAEKYFTSPDRLVTLALAPRGPQFATREVTLRDFALARELGIPVTVHAGDGRWGRSRPVAWMLEHGLADARTTYVHGNTLADDEYDIIARTGGALSIAPELEMHMGHGPLSTLRARDRGIPVSLSVDVCSSVGGDMFSAMRAALSGTRYLVNVAALEAGESVDPLPITAVEVLRFATQGGATAAWLGGTVGSLTPGKRADVILLRTDVYGMRPLNHPAGAVVESGNPGLVETVFVDGKPVKRDGVLVGHDFAHVRGLAEDARDRVLARAGVTDPGRWRPPPYSAPGC
ncbi:amidohydrolase family protein [Planotetraspora kaengkrachanensis]|uniref:TRZ/ATZ family hydrolase n=1 Tax=Planotetraspora kaengkrachanensis TaxID=575193 RepID=A0A8J3PVZ3_9ACTN|nr:amidohydrolase family protein [Planotetraspora kaengkrachanensis]GIG82104.1 TRZ/ATZ family hydrolase [Planotetraspora kaengkrachanensis]